MIELWQGIYTYFSESAKTTALRGLLTGGLHNTEAKQGTEFPYGTFSVMNTPDNFASGKRFVENCLVQFNFYSDAMSQAEVLGISDALAACFDFENIEVSGYIVLSCVREPTVPLKVDNIWQISVRYRMKLKEEEV